MAHVHTTRKDRRLRRRARVRSRISGTSERPRLSVFRSARFLYAQLVDDLAGKTLLGVHSKKLGDVSGDAGDRTGKTAEAYALGQLLAQKAKEQNITTVVFDRGGYAYHGRVKALADGARDGGLQF